MKGKRGCLDFLIHVHSNTVPCVRSTHVCLCRCANPYDPNVSILQVAGTPKNRYQRRFVVKAFQFMDQKTNQYLNEEVSGGIMGLNGQS